MNFEFSEEQLFIREQARNFLTAQCTPAVVRGVLEGDASYDKDLWQALAELGWTATAIPEAYGGLGLGYLELCVIAEELGRVVAPVPFASSVYLASEAIKSWGSEAQKQNTLPSMATGERIGTLAHAENLSTKVATEIRDGKLYGKKMPVPDGDIADIAIVTARDADGVLRLCLLDLDQAGVKATPLNSMDPSRSQAILEFDGADAQLLGEGAATNRCAEVQLDEILDRAAVLLSFEQIGGAQAAMEMGIAYTKERYAFGRPVASFQAIKHKFADMYVAVELARANAYYGAWALESDAPDLPLAAATTRVCATDAYYMISKENIQAHGGMGFTWEFDCHLYYRRAQLLASLIGAQPMWKDHLATRLLAAA